MTEKKQLLDPLGTICKLVGLSFCELKTKISIQNHVLVLQKPYNYQPIVRTWYGDNKENISELYYAIIRVIKWYLAPSTTQQQIGYLLDVSRNPFDQVNQVNENNEAIDQEQECEKVPDLVSIEEIYETTSNHTPSDNNTVEPNWVAIHKSDELKRMIKYTCDALKKLQCTYEFGNVVLAIQYYINILEDSADGKCDERHLPVFISDKEFTNLLDYEKLRNFWDFKKLKRICQLYDNCFAVLNDKEITINEKDALLEGYLKSIKSILEITDTEFQKLISNSNKG